MGELTLSTMRSATWARCAPLLLSILLGCGGGSGPHAIDGAAGDASEPDASLDAAGDANTICSSNRDCFDAVFCNGAERCQPEDPGADDFGCVAAVRAACIAGQTCDEARGLCLTMCEVNADADGDGHDSVDCGGNDCDDANAAINPGAIEVCDSDVDNDCNGLADAADGVCVPCGVGYSGVDGACTNIDECTDSTPCGAIGATCSDTDGSYACTCPAGYSAPATGGTCTDEDECSLGIEDCDTDPAAICINTVGGFDCRCDGFAGDGHGPSGCGELVDARLSSLTPSVGSLSPVFAPDVPTYQVALPPGVTSVFLTPTVAYPGRATIRIDGVVAASGASSSPITLSGFTPVLVSISVVTESGASRTYTVIVGRGNHYLKASNTNTGDRFGWPLALSSDGSTLAVGAWLEDSNSRVISGDATDNSARDAGAVYIFVRTGSAWSQQAYIKASNSDTFDAFGFAVALSANGSTLAVGAIGESSNATGVDGAPTNNSLTDAGAAYVFTRTGITWSQQAYIKSSNTNVLDEFGMYVALSGDGATLAVGTTNEDSSAIGIDGDQFNNSASGSGAVYVFRRIGSTWSQEAYIKASNSERNDWFGTGVTLSADGSTLAVGASHESSSAAGVNGDQADNGAPTAGAVYVFARTGTTWAQQAYVKASNSEAGDAFGDALTLSADGSTLAVGAVAEASNANGINGDQADDSMPWAGAVYVFTRTGATWTQQAYVKASNTGIGDTFGLALALTSDGSTLAVGADYERSAATGIGGDQDDNSRPVAGAAYMFSRVGGTWSQQAYIKASNTDADDEFAGFLALSADGSTLAIGAFAEASGATGVDGDQTDNGEAEAGAVYVF
ncbi:MAG: hypothetical protein GXP55_00510 [Deltaproteobacteria bacterium]|nr:hypothetical protein [Deltaproteobacteria bacterium]